MVNFWNNDVLFWTPLYQSTKYESRIDSKNLNTLSRSSLKQTRLPEEYGSSRPFTHHLMLGAQKRQAISQSGKI